MSVINPLARELSAKIVYYGPGMSGKTTSLQHVHSTLKASHKGDLISLATEGDRTLYFDFLPIHIGKVRDLDVRLQLYTVPGQVFYGATRKLVLEGADGIVFVADSQIDAHERNLESMEDLRQNLIEFGTSLESVPLVIQYNKRDLPNVGSLELMRRQLNTVDAPDFGTTASKGVGVIESLKTITKLVTDHLSDQAPTSGRGGPSQRQILPTKNEITEKGPPSGFVSQITDALEHMDDEIGRPTVTPNALETAPPPKSTAVPQVDTLHETESSQRRDRPRKTEPPRLTETEAKTSPSASSGRNSGAIPEAPSLTDLGSSGIPPAIDPPPSSLDLTRRRILHSDQKKNDAKTIQAPAAPPLSFASLWDEPSLIRAVEQSVATGHYAEAVYRAAGGVSTILDTLLGPYGAEGSATRAQLLGLDGHEYLKLRRLCSRPAAALNQKDALFALYVLVAVRIKEARL